MMMMSVLMASTNVSPHRPGGDGNVRRQRRHDGRRRCAQRARDLVQRRRAGARGHVLEDADTARGGLFTEDGDFVLRDAWQADGLQLEIERSRNLHGNPLLLAPTLQQGLNARVEHPDVVLQTHV